MLRERAKTVPEGAFITAVGGLQPRQFAENRLPTLTELDAAAPRHPVYLHVTFNGPATTNTLGKKFLEGKGVPVEGIRLIEQNGPYEIHGDPAIMKPLDELLKAFVEQHRMKLPGGAAYVPCYRVVQ